MSKSIKILSTFLLCAVTLFYTSVTAFASDYSGLNDTVYKSADLYGLEELPYGDDTAVVQIQYNSTQYLTLYFDKCSVYRTDNNVVNYNPEYLKLTDYYWDVRQALGYNKTIEIMSDSPIYYRTSYDSDTGFTSTIGELIYINVVTSVTDSNGDFYAVTEEMPVYSFDGSLTSIVGSLSHNSVEIHSNKFMTGFSRFTDSDGEDIYLYYPVANGSTSSSVGSHCYYNVTYYPTVEYLQNKDLHFILQQNWQQLVFFRNDVLTELYSVNYWLGEIYSYSANISNQLDVYLPNIDYTLYEILETLKGPEYDSSQGLGSNTEFGDSVGGLMQDTEVPSIGSDSIATNLGNSFLFIRNMFDRVTADFNLNYVISFLLGLSFIAYVLGRVIKNKMKS